MVMYLKDSLLYTVYLFAASALSIVTSLIPMYISRALTTNEDVRALVLAISIIISMIITIYILLYKSGYNKNRSYESNKNHKLLIIVALTGVIHFITGLLTQYFVVLYFYVTYLAPLIIGEPGIDIVSLQNKHFTSMTLSYCLITIPLLISMILGFFKGVQKRQKDREKTLSETN